jgi:carboxymethylenebutenolidase
MLADQIHAPVLGLYGGADAGIPVADVERMKRALATAHDNRAAQASRLVVYPDAPHAFHADYRTSYRASAAQDGWTRAQAWFKQYL